MSECADTTRDNARKTRTTAALAGAAYRGVGIPDCIRSGEGAADAVLRLLEARAAGAGSAAMAPDEIPAFSTPGAHP